MLGQNNPAEVKIARVYWSEEGASWVGGDLTTMVSLEESTDYGNEQCDIDDHARNMRCGAVPFRIFDEGKANRKR